MRLRSLIVAATLVYVPAASAHDVETHLSPSGVQFVNDNLRSHVPSSIDLDPIEIELFECSGDNATVTQRDTHIDLDVHALSLTQPRAGALRLDVTFSAVAAGEVFFDKPFACIGDVLCNDAMTVDNARAIVELGASLDPAGAVQLEVTDVDLTLDPANLDVSLADCALATLGNMALDAAQDLALDALVELVEDLAKKQLAPVLTSAVSGFIDTDIGLGLWTLSTRLDEISLDDGIRVTGDIDLSAERPPASCFSDPGEPAPHAGRRPDLLQTNTHLAMSLNLGVIDDLLYHLWSSGVRCDGVELDASFAADYLPDFPEGTVWRLRANLRTPPRITSKDGEGAELEIVLPELAFELTADLPSGNTRTADIAVEARVAATAWLDAHTTSLGMQLSNARVTNIALSDEIGLAAHGFDAARIRRLIDDVYLQNILSSLLSSELTVPLGLGADGYYGILRTVDTTLGYLAIGADLFRAPDSDTSAPNTAIESAPSGVVAPGALIGVSGTDNEIPSELLRYRARINGVSIAESKLPRVVVGLPGQSGSFTVEISAVDLAGNEDPSPASIEIIIDGVRPTAQITSSPHLGRANSLEPRLRFERSDDRTAATALSARLEIVELPGSALPGQPTLQPIESGATEVAVDGLAPDRTYRVTLVVTDEAGNEGVDSIVFATPRDSGGCSTTGAGSGASTALLILLGVCLLRLRRGAALAALFTAACGSPDSSFVQDDPLPPEPVELPACASDLASSMWDAMQPVAHNSTVPMHLAAGAASQVDPMIYLSGPEIFGKWAELIESAESEVNMQFYKWEPGTDATETILGGIKALERKRYEDAPQAPPVKVRIVIDTSALGTAAPVTQDHMPMIIAQFDAYNFDDDHVDIEWAADERTLLDQFSNVHVKTVVVDRKVAMITGANPEAQHNFDQPWHDAGAVFSGDIVDAFLADFDYTWNGAKRWVCPAHLNDLDTCFVAMDDVSHEPMDRPVPASGTSQVCAVMALTREPANFVNNDVDNPQDQAFLAAFDNARTVIKIETPNINDDAVKTALVAAAERGVTVQLITSLEFNETAEKPVGGPNGQNVAELYQTLALRGVPDACERFQVRWYSRDGVQPIVGNGPYASHTKYSSYDNQVVIVGTTNMDTASWNFSHELNLAIDDADTTAAFDRRLFDADWQRAIVADECKR